jgi:hypothetical protein
MDLAVIESSEVEHSEEQGSYWLDEYDGSGSE